MAPQASSRAARNTVSPAFDPVEASGTEPLVDGVDPEPGEVVDDVVVVDDEVVEFVVVVEVVDGGGSVVVVVVVGTVVVVVADPVTSNSTPVDSRVPPSLSVAPKKAV